MVSLIRSKVIANVWEARKLIKGNKAINSRKPGKLTYKLKTIFRAFRSLVLKRDDFALLLEQTGNKHLINILSTIQVEFSGAKTIREFDKSKTYKLIDLVCNKYNLTHAYAFIERQEIREMLSSFLVVYRYQLEH